MEWMRRMLILGHLRPYEVQKLRINELEGAMVVTPDRAIRL